MISVLFMNEYIRITEEVVKTAAGNFESGKDVMVLLLDHRGNEVKITGEVVEVVAGSGKDVMTLLLDDGETRSRLQTKWLRQQQEIILGRI